jgi:predicted Zn-dependent peptidase
MLFRGTPSHPSAHALALAFEEQGATLSAFTATDHGTLAVGGPVETFDRVLGLLAEVHQSPVFDGIAVEKGIVREEILEGLDDDGNRIDADDLLREVLFPQHPLGQPITGTLTHLESFDGAQLRAHHAAHYGASNATLTIAGALDPNEALDRAEATFGSLFAGSRPSPGGAPSTPAERSRYVRHVSSQTALRIGFRAPAARDPLEPATELLLRLLDDGMATRLYHRVCDLGGLCYDVSANYESFDDSGAFELAAETGHDNAGRVASEMFALLTELRSTGPSERELAKAKARHRWQMEELLDSPGATAEFFGIGALLGQARHPLERAEELTLVPRDAVMEAARSLLKRENLAFIAVGKLPKRAQESLARMSETF